jgi:hypothetical protein
MWYILTISMVLLVTGTVGGGQVVSPSKLAELKKDARVFERIIGEVLRQNFDNPFAVAADPMAAYLPGYGVVVSFHLRINRGTIRGFRGDLPSPVVREPRSREEQLEVVRRTMLRALADYGSTMKNLGETERVSIYAHVEDRNELDPAKNRAELVVSSVKADIDRYLTREIDLDEFRRRVESLEY